MQSLCHQREKSMQRVVIAQLQRCGTIGNNETPVATFTLPDRKKFLLGNKSGRYQRQHLRLQATCWCGGDSEGTLYVWDVEQQHTRHTLKAHEDWVSSITISPDEKLFVSITHYTVPYHGCGMLKTVNRLKHFQQEIMRSLHVFTL